MKLNKISAFIFLISSFSLYSMEELADGKERNNLVKPHINPAAGVFETDECNSDEDDDGTFDFLEEAVDGENDIPEKFLSEKEGMAHRAFNSLHLYANDHTYQKIPANQRGKFIRRECNLNNDPNSFYRKFEIYNIRSAKKRYDLIKKHDRENRNKILLKTGFSIGALASVTLAAVCLGQYIVPRGLSEEELYAMEIGRDVLNSINVEKDMEAFLRSAWSCLFEKA